jgi:hypothetical protein
MVLPCGNTLYTQEYNFGEDDKSVSRVWRCTNCGAEYARATRRGMTNSRRARIAYDKLKQEWADVDAGLQLAVDAGQPSGCLLVYSSTFSTYHSKFLTASKPTLRDIRSWTRMCRYDIESGRQFVARYAKVAYA